jgi:hypothetical protein
MESAGPERSRRTRRARWPAGYVVTRRLNENAARETRRFHDQPFGSNYFETDFLNMRSIFSLVASTED